MDRTDSKNTQPGAFDPGCAGELSAGDYVLVKVTVAAAA